MRGPSTTAEDMSTSLISFPLLKFSYALDPSTKTEKFSWNHTTQNLFVVFDSFRSGPDLPSKMMKVVQGIQTLESVDIEEKIKSALSVVESMRKYGVEIRNEQLPISALVRCPLFAIRYNFPDGKIRRLQLKFTSENDFQTVYDLLHSMGCQITHSVPPSNSTSSTNHDNTEPPCQPSSLATLGSRPERPPSTNAVGFSNEITSVRPSSPQRIDAVSSVESVRPQTMQTLLPSQIPQSTTYEKSTNQSEPYRNVISAQNLTQNRHPLNAEQSIHSSTAYQNASPAPPPSRVYRTFTLPSNTTFGTRNEGGQSSAVSDASRQTGSIQSTHDKYQHYENIMRTMGLPFASSSSASRSVEQAFDPTASATRTHYSHLQTIVESDATSGQRPWTAPISQVEDTLTQLMPPRRELPFQRTSTAQRPSGARLTENSSRPSSSTVDLPPLPKPNFVHDVARASTAPTAAHRQNGHSYNDQQQAGSSNASSNEPNGQQAHPPASDSAIGLAKQHLSAPSDPQSSILGFHTSRATIDPSETAYMDRIVTRVSAEAALGDAESLAAYATRPTDERRTLINDWMMRHIEDDDFLTLCQDVWGCWRRIGLGL